MSDGISYVAKSWNPAAMSDHYRVSIQEHTTCVCTTLPALEAFRRFHSEPRPGWRFLGAVKCDIVPGAVDYVWEAVRIFLPVLDGSKPQTDLTRLGYREV